MKVLSTCQHCGTDIMSSKGVCATCYPSAYRAPADTPRDPLESASESAFAFADRVHQPEMTTHGLAACVHERDEAMRREGEEMLKSKVSADPATLRLLLRELGYDWFPREDMLAFPVWLEDDAQWDDEHYTMEHQLAEFMKFLQSRQAPETQGEDCPKCGARPGNAHRLRSCARAAARADARGGEG